MTVPVIAAPSANSVRSTLSATFTRGTDSSIALADGAAFPNPTPLGHVVLIHADDDPSSKYCILVYDDKSDADTLTMDAATDYATAVNLGGGAAVDEVFQIGAIVDLVIGVEEIARLFAVQATKVDFLTAQVFL